jgi:hypothetical protein
MAYKSENSFKGLKFAEVAKSLTKTVINMTIQSISCMMYSISNKRFTIFIKKITIFNGIIIIAINYILSK